MDMLEVVRYEYKYGFYCSEFRMKERERILEFCVAVNMMLENTPL